MDILRHRGAVVSFTALLFFFCVFAVPTAFAAPKPPRDSGNIIDDILTEGSGAGLGGSFGISRAKGACLNLTYDGIGAYGYYWAEFKPLDISAYRFVNFELDMKSSLFTPEVKIEFKEKRATENMKFVLHLSKSELTKNRGNVSVAIPKDLGFVNIVAVVVEPHRFVRVSNKDAFIERADRLLTGENIGLAVEDSSAFELYREFQKGSVVVRSVTFSEKPRFAKIGEAEEARNFVVYEDLDEKGEPYLQVIFGQLKDYGWATVPVKLTNMEGGIANLDEAGEIRVTFKSLKDKRPPQWFRVEFVGDGRLRTSVVVERSQFTDSSEWVTVLFDRSKWKLISETAPLGAVDFIDVVVAPGEDLKKGAKVETEDLFGAFGLKFIEFVKAPKEPDKVVEPSGANPQ
ncbi:MAG: hypothetical protein PHE61_06655 [Candidatus Omnitrophica bacterium]|nr:hypothetical protein [Candidatus Omnitrophota bacterium]